MDRLTDGVSEAAQRAAQREQFEKYAADTNHFGSLSDIQERRRGDYYTGVALRVAWQYWQAASVAASADVRELREALQLAFDVIREESHIADDQVGQVNQEKYDKAEAVLKKHGGL